MFSSAREACAEGKKLHLRKCVLKLRAGIATVALLAVSFATEALTLGRVRGAALVGQPLEVVIPVQMEAAEADSSLCFEADVFHADTRQDSGRVRVLTETVTPGQAVNVRILSSTPVDEPMVTVYLRTGCGQKTTRRYVLLADLPSEPAAPVAAPVLARTTTVPASQTEAARPRVASTPVPRAPAAEGGVPKVRAPRPVGAAKAVVSKEVLAPVKAPVPLEEAKPVKLPAQSRLTLDPLEFYSDRVANLGPSGSNAATEYAIADLRRTETLEGEIKTLMATAARNEASLLDLKARLQKAEADSLPREWIYALLALVFASLGALAWLWTRQRHLPVGAGAWWSGSVLAEEPVQPTGPHDPAPVTEPVIVSAVAEAPVSDFPASLTQNTGIDLNLIDMSDSNFAHLMQSKADQVVAPVKAAAPVLMPEIEEPAESLPASRGHNFNSHAVQDIRQQAEFFTSLGQTDQAVKLLEQQLNESPEANPHIYLDLLSICHSLGLKVEFRQYRQEFNLLFNGKAPEFVHFKDEGRGLEDYPDTLSQITAFWPTAQATEVIEAFIFRSPGLSLDHSFDLAAFRELLLLHAVAQDGKFAQMPRKAALQPAAVAAAWASAPPELQPQPVSLTPDFNLDELPPEALLDLDLTGDDMSDMPLPDLPVENFQLPHILPGEPHVGGPSSWPASDGNLINFDMSDWVKPSGPAGEKSTG